MIRCRFADDPNFPCKADLSKVDLGYHYGKNHMTEPTAGEYAMEVVQLKEMLAVAASTELRLRTALEAIATPKEPNSLGEPLSRLILAQEQARRALAQEPRR